MRLLVVFVLVALALPSLAFDICPSGSLFDTTVETISPGQTYTATSCNISGYVTLSASSASIGSVPISITVENSVVNGLFQINLLSLSRAPTRPPMYITVQKNVFNNGAGFSLSRALPPNSIVTFQGNQMSSDGTVDYFGYGIALMVYFDTMNLYPNTTINVISNTMTFNAVNQISAQLLILHVDTVTGNGTVNMLSNTIKANGTSGENVLIYAGWNMGENSTLRIDSNTLVGTNSSGSLNGVILNTVGGIQISDLQRSFSVADIEGRNNWVSFSNNNINLSGEYVDDKVITFNEASKVNLRIDGNAITTNYGYFIYCDDEIAPAYYASITGNSFASTRASLTTSLIYVYQYEFATNSTLVIASNTITAPSVTETPLFVEIDRTFIESTASIKHCGNTLPWTNSSTTVNQLFSTTVVDLVVYDANVCVATTAPATTRAPSSFAKINTWAVIVGLFIAVVSML